MTEQELKELFKEGLIEEGLIECLKEEIIGMVKAIKVVARNIPFFYHDLRLNPSYYLKPELYKLSPTIIKEEDPLMNIILDFIIDSIIEKKSQTNKDLVFKN